MNFWLPLLGSALGGAVVTAIFGLFKGRQEKLTEHTQWLRDQKMEEYTSLLNFLQGVVNFHRPFVEQGAKAKPQSLPEEIQMGGLTLLAPESVRVPADDAVAAVRRLSESVHDWAATSLKANKQAPLTASKEALTDAQLNIRALRGAMRDDLKIKL